MSRKAKPAGGAVNHGGVIDVAIERVLGLAATREEPGERHGRRVAFERILLLHLAARLLTGAYPDAEPGSAVAVALAAAAALAAALVWVPRLASAALAIALLTLASLVATTFPQTSNHGFLELWCIALLLLSGRGTPDADALALAALRWSVAIVLFYTGVQKALHGTYFDAQFLSVEIALKPEFAKVFGLLAPADVARLQALDPSLVGSGPFRSEAPLLLLASNLVVAFELLAPVLLLTPRTRRLAVCAVVLFTVAIQSGAREAFFGGLLVNLVLLFWPRDLHRRALPLFAFFYGSLVLLRLLAPGALKVQ